MIQIGISDISKNPSLIDKLGDVTQIVNKKTKQIKGIFVPVALLDRFSDVFEELEYQQFVERNRTLADTTLEDETTEDGLSDAAW